MKTILVSAIVIALGVSTISAQEKKDDAILSNSKIKKQTVSLLKSLETGDKKAANIINSKKYIQHNQNVEDGVKGFAAFADNLPKSETTVNTVRVFQDGDYVFAHSEYNVYGSKIGFDIFRFENGKIVEHFRPV